MKTTAQQYNQNLYQSLRWRCIGPFRAGRTVGATGVPGQPNVFYRGRALRRKRSPRWIRKPQPLKAQAEEALVAAEALACQDSRANCSR
ncbi:MAG TPA: hypothetical protein VFY40_15000 [Blastocatellia bacterium]|nr:hypothetical protein [Blastocatellia bacterium]